MQFILPTFFIIFLLFFYPLLRVCYIKKGRQEYGPYSNFFLKTNFRSHRSVSEMALQVAAIEIYNTKLSLLKGFNN